MINIFQVAVNQYENTERPRPSYAILLQNYNKTVQVLYFRN